MKFFNIDRHVSIISDLSHIFKRLGHTVNSLNQSGHSWVLNRKAIDIPLLKKGNLANLRRIADEFTKNYKAELDQYDGFIVTYPPAYAWLYSQFDKPVILHIPIRYEYPFSNNPKEWMALNDLLMQDKYIIVANSLYDKNYFEAFVNKECKYIPSLCSYFNRQYSPINGWRSYNRQPDGFFGLEPIKFPYTWDGIVSYRALVHAPYNASIMSFFEQYWANIPLFVPTIRFLLEMRSEGYPLLSEISWNRTFKLKSKSAISCKCEYDPNNYESDEAMLYWMRYADYYNFKHVLRFDSLDHLQEYKNREVMLLPQITEMMKKENAIREGSIMSQWKEVLSGLY